MSRSETLDKFIAARAEDPITTDELTPGELIAVARYHLDYVIAMGAAGRSGDDDVIEHLEEALMNVAQAVADYQKSVGEKTVVKARRGRPANG